MQKLRFSHRHVFDLLLNEKQKKPFVCLNNESSEALHTSQTSWVFAYVFSRKQNVKQRKIMQPNVFLVI